MTDGKDPKGELSPAEAAFVEFLAAHDSEPPLDFDTFVARHRQHEPELRRLHEEWLNVARVLRRGRDEATPRAEQLEELRLDADGEELKLEFAGDLVRRLANARSATERYESRGELARGGMGVIYRVWDPHLRRQLAMKVILARKEVTSPEERGRAMHRALARFLEEAQVTSQLDHPGIVPVHDLGIDGKGRVYFTMRLVRGRDFRRIIELATTGGEGWTPARALGVLLKVCEAVAYAHSKGVIHRDLKPANVMVGRFGEVYVMDWGLSRVLGAKDSHDMRISKSDSTAVSRIDTDVRRWTGPTPGSLLLTMDGRVVGTPSYMSPEQARGRVEDIGTRTDVFAIGALLYHLLTGEMPYVPPGANVSPHNVYKMLLAGPPAPVKQLAPDAPDELVAICDKATAREPADRYQGPLEMAADLEAYLDRRPVTARPLTLRYLSRLFFERNRALSITVATAVLVVATVVPVAWHKNVEKQRENARLLDLRTAQALASSTEELFPALPQSVATMDRWLAAAGELLSRAPGYHAQLVAARARGDRETIDLLEGPVRDVDRLEHELMPQIAKWRAMAADLTRVSLEVEDRKWAEAVEDVGRLKVYGGLTLGKQLGLVPLRRDPASGLWEFWHVLTGERPAPDPDRPDRWKLTDATGVILVLVPAGKRQLGYPSAKLLPVTNSELHDVDLRAFFLGKHEVTQSQWLRVMYSNPSMFHEHVRVDRRFDPNDPPTADSRYSTLLHPVESVSWDECATFLRRVGLEFPTEDQWEFAARGGANGVFWWSERPAPDDAGPFLWTDAGVDFPAFEGRENVADACTRAAEGYGVPGADWNDGFRFHSPVGSFAPNPFGLFDVLGNVTEWCGDAVPDPELHLIRRTLRGAHWFTTERELLPLSVRAWDDPRVVQAVRGLRAARSLR